MLSRTYEAYLGNFRENEKEENAKEERGRQRGSWVTEGGGGAERG